MHCCSRNFAKRLSSIIVTNDVDNMPNKIREDLLKIDATSFPYIYEENVSIKLKSFKGVVRANVYRPKTEERVPVLVTYGPYGKDIHYKE